MDTCIIADDFTGAMDSGAPFARDGYHVHVLLHPPADPETVARGTLAVCTDSREIGGAEAYAVVKGVVCAVGSGRTRRVFKKIDSTMRGNVADEIAAILDNSVYSCAIVAPAAPKNGRTVVDGRCLVHGMPSGPAGQGVRPLFQHRFADRVAGIGLEVVRKGRSRFVAELDRLRARGTGVVVVDAESIEDLRVVGSAATQPDVLLAGSSGLAEAVCGTGPAGGPAAGTPVFSPGTMLFVVGSLAQTTGQQVEFLLGLGLVQPVTVCVQSLLEDESAEAARVLGEVVRADQQKPLLIRPDASDSEHSRSRESPGDRVDERRLHRRVSSFLGLTAKQILDLRPVHALFASGGDTASGVAEALHIESILLEREVLPGIVRGRCSVGHHGPPLTFVTKSGGFGTVDSMATVLSTLTGGAS